MSEEKQGIPHTLLYAPRRWADGSKEGPGLFTPAVRWVTPAAYMGPEPPPLGQGSSSSLTHPVPVRMLSPCFGATGRGSARVWWAPRPG